MMLLLSEANGSPPGRRARPLQAARLDLERVEAAVAVGVDPAADRIADEGRLDRLRPFAPVGEDAAGIVDVLDQEIGHLRRDEDLDRREGRHDPRHAGREAGVGRVGALPAGGLVLRGWPRRSPDIPASAAPAGPAPLTLRRVVGRLAGDAGDGDAAPRTLPIRILRLVEGERAGKRRAERSEEGDGGDRAFERHAGPR